ncbi:hypothetical protein AB0952_02520 [Streptomyces caniferus]|uniref:hypothetical protein n=1 Tax=Streptomyces caniferus TaxID=285557 RepID=UPI00345735F8
MVQSMRIRFLAVGRVSRWLAVSGVVDGGGQHPLRGAIETYATSRPLRLFLDFTECRVTDLSAGMLREVIAPHSGLRLCLICVPARISRSCAVGRRCVFLPDVRSAWTRWEQVEPAASPPLTAPAETKRK